MYYLLSITLISSSEKPSKLLSQRYFFVSETITPLNPNNAIQLGHAIKPFNMSAISHTKSRAVTQPINTTIVQQTLKGINAFLPKRYSQHFSP